MIDMRKRIVEIISEATKLNCYYISAPKDAELPCVVYNEVNNTDYLLALNNEYANLAYTFTVYVKNPREIFETVYSIDEIMKQEGFTKDYSSQDMYADDVYSKTLRFKAIVNNKGEIFN